MLRVLTNISITTVYFVSTTQAFLLYHRPATSILPPRIIQAKPTALSVLPSDNRDATTVPPAARTISRRNLLLSTSINLLLPLTSILPPAFIKNADAASGTTARVSEYPSIAYLEPIYELQLSVDALAGAVRDASRWPIVRKRLDQFFGGGIVSEKNYYAGVAFAYVRQIKYAKEELGEYVRIDKDQRFAAFDAALKSLEALKEDIASGKDSSVVEGDVDAARRLLRQWFSYVPEGDYDAVGKLFRAVRAADANRDRRLDEGELATLSGTDRTIWKKRVELYGDV